MGDTADDIFQSFRLSEDDEKKYDRVKARFEEYFMKKKNVIYERAKLRLEGESVDSFITALYSLASYGELHDEMIRDRIVVGNSKLMLSEKMQLDDKLTLEDASKLARESEAVRKQQSHMRETGETRDSGAVDRVRKQPSRGSYNNCSKRSGQLKAKPQEMGSPKPHPKVCTRCGKDHPYGKDTVP